MTSERNIPVTLRPAHAAALVARREQGAQMVGAAAEAVGRQRELSDALRRAQEERPLGPNATNEVPSAPSSPILEGVGIGLGAGAEKPEDDSGIPSSDASLGSRENPVLVGGSSQSGLATARVRLGGPQN